MEGGRERSDWRGIFFFIFFFNLLLDYCFVLFCCWGEVLGGLDRWVVYLYCMDENGDYGSVVVVVVVGNRCPRISG